jgi:hypothetical protein
MELTISQSVLAVIDERPRWPTRKLRQNRDAAAEAAKAVVQHDTVRP